MISVSRYHDISCGHRVVGHEGKCRSLHGHNYRVHFECQASEMDALGRVIDFSVIKQKLCMWLEDTWDHKMLLWERDPLLTAQFQPAFDKHRSSYDELALGAELLSVISESFVSLPFNPTAENMAKHLVHVIGPQQLTGTGVTLVRVTVEETRKCSACAVLIEGEL